MGDAPGLRAEAAGSARPPRLALTWRDRWDRLHRFQWQPPRPHGEQPRERVVGPLELCYDLAVAVLVAQAARRLAGHLTVWGAFMRNASHLPAFQVRVFFHYAQEEPGGSWSTSMRGGPAERIRVIPPGDDRFVEIPDQVRKMIDQCDDQVYMTSIEFTDAIGVLWERDPRGELGRQ
jgi:hypothetical protein